jgi:hypothetical protein
MVIRRNVHGVSRKSSEATYTASERNVALAHRGVTPGIRALAGCCSFLSVKCSTQLSVKYLRSIHNVSEYRLFPDYIQGFNTMGIIEIKWDPLQAKSDTERVARQVLPPSPPVAADEIDA